MTHSTKSWIDQLIGSKANAWIHANKVEGVFPTEVIGVKGPYLVLKNKIPPEYILDVMDSEAFVLNTNLGVMHAKSLVSGGRNILFRYHDPDLVSNLRKHRRYSFAANENVYLKIRNPYDQKTILKKGIMDLSKSGLSYRSPIWSHIQHVGLVVEGCVYIDGNPFKKVEAQNVYVRKVIEWGYDEWYQVGIKFLEKEIKFADL